MAPLAFYDALAASASVFIGILTALLISNLSTITTARGRIARRITAINAQVESLASRRDRLKEDLERIEETWMIREQENAKDDVERFIDRDVGSDFVMPIEHLTFQDLIEALADYLDWDVEDINQYHEDELEAHMAEIEAELVVAVVGDFASEYEDMPRRNLYDLDWEEFRDDFKSQHGVENLDAKTHNMLRSEYDSIVPDEVPSGLFGQLPHNALSGLAAPDPLLDASFSTPVSNDVWATQVQQEGQQRRHEENQYNRDKNQHFQAVTEIRALETEREQLKTRFESLDPSQLRGAIRTCVGTILASVLFPLFVHLLYVLGVVLPVPASWTVAEPVLVFLVWIAGLGWVFLHIWNEVTEETVDVPDDSPET